MLAALALDARERKMPEYPERLNVGKGNGWKRELDEELARDQDKDKFSMPKPSSRAF